MSTPNTFIIVILIREVNHLNIYYSYLKIKFDVTANGVVRSLDGANIGLFNYGTLPLSSSKKLKQVVEEQSNT